jgi:hypothetical protein
MYGTMPTTAISVTSPAMSALLPYREDTKSASDVMRLALLMRTILRTTTHHSTIMSVGPM